MVNTGQKKRDSRTTHPLTQIPKRSLHCDSQSSFPGVSTRPQLFMQLAQAVWQSYMASGSYPSDGVVTVFCCDRSALTEYTPATAAPATDKQIINTASRASGEGFLKIFHTHLIHYNGSMVSRGLHINHRKPGKQGNKFQPGSSAREERERGPQGQGRLPVCARDPGSIR